MKEFLISRERSDVMSAQDDLVLGGFLWEGASRCESLPRQTGDNYKIFSAFNACVILDKHRKWLDLDEQ